MVDSTVNVTEGILQRMKNFISYSMARFYQLDRSLMMGVMQFSDANSAKVVKKVSTYTDRRDVDKVLRKMKPQRGFKRLTGDALTEASKTVSFVNLRFLHPLVEFAVVDISLFYITSLFVFLHKDLFLNTVTQDNT